jgi:hypothetical protein
VGALPNITSEKNLKRIYKNLHWLGAWNKNIGSKYLLLLFVLAFWDSIVTEMQQKLKRSSW